MVQELAKNFQECQFEHMPRTQNRYADALATMASKVEVSETQNFVCKVINQKCSVILGYKRGFELEEWQQQIVNKLTEPKTTSFKERRYFIMIKDTLYHQSLDGVFARCLRQEEAIARMEEIHDISCGIEGPKLSRRLQRAGYYWDNMEEDAASLQKDCLNCQLIFNSTKAILITEIDDWRRPYQEYFRDKVTPCDKKEKEKLLRHISKYCLKDNNDLYRKGFNGKLLRCISNEEAEEVIKEIHHGDCDNGTPFTGKSMKNLLEDYQISHGKSTRYYPQGNGIAEVFNKLLLQVLSRMVHVSPAIWHEFVPLALWAYHTSKRGSTGFTPFSLVYGSEAVLPVEIAVPSAKLSMAAGMDVHQARLEELELVDEL
ncbi:uncharacterized protein LOC133831869 [Humulus lupulus]|uniref:uncharacterized protein LOC133831869 n=1 Tax=Humulus lupulus TaxID=3486 RepID=UPI002B409A09|nr:uncharacterized protein LOC133831869 [Humulus lupulus]